VTADPHDDDVRRRCGGSGERPACSSEKSWNVPSHTTEAVHLKPFIAESKNVRIFQAPFTDTGILPWDIDGLRNAGAI
jgi:hypothetical protein